MSTVSVGLTLGPVLEKPRLTMLELTERCGGCAWPAVCENDRTCWQQESAVKAEVGRYRKRECSGLLAGNETDVAPAGRAAGRAHAVGTGENAHPWADALQRLVDDAGRPLEIRVPEALPAENTRLMESLGVTVIVDANAPPIAGQIADLERPAQPAHDETAAEPGPRDDDVVLAAPARSRKGAGPGPKWTRESAIAAVQAWAQEHGHPPPSNHRDRSLPSGPTAQKRFGGWANLIEAAGLPRPTKGTRYRPGTSAVPAPAETADMTDPPAQAAQPERESLPRPAAPDARAAALNLLDALRRFVDAVLPEERP